MMNAELQQYITVAAIEPVNIKSIRAFAAIRIGTLIVHNLRVIQKPDGDLWVALSKEEKKENGQTTYPPIVEVTDRDIMRAISDVVIAAYKNETSPQQTLRFLQGGGPAREAPGEGKQRRRRVAANSPRQAKHSGRPVFAEIYLTNEDISDVGA